MDDARRPVTILFTDFVGSTSHAEKLDPEEWKEIVKGAHRRVTGAVTRYEGTVAQLLGDGVLAGLTSPLVGRERELKQLHDGLNELRAGQGQIVFVLGVAGIGKTRLLEEARSADGISQKIQEQTDFMIRDTRSAIRFIEGRALSYGQSLSFWTITQLLQNDLGLGESEPQARIQVALRRRVKELFGEKSEEVLPYLGHLLGVTLEDQAAERVKMLDGETLKRQVLISIAEYFTKLAQQQPTVLVLEDLHWADPSSLDALERLLRVTERAPLMILVLMRSETDKPAWHVHDLAAREYRRRFHEIELEPLPPSDANELVNNLLEVLDISDALRQWILERAEGNPFYLEEIIRALIEQGMLVRDEQNHWRAQSDITNLHIPDTLQALLLARIDRLQDDVKRTLQLASVIGRTFLFKLLEAISDAERELDWHISQLERADLVHEKARIPELEYMFKHSLTQEAAYESLLYGRRKEFHKRVAVALEKLFAERTEDFLGLLAYHFDCAGDHAKAIDYLIRAGDKARLSDAHKEAIQFYERARDLLLETGDLGRAAKTWLKLGLIYHTNFEFEKAHAANEEAFELQRQARDVTQHQEPAITRNAISRPELRFVAPIPASLDPGYCSDVMTNHYMISLFAGLVEIDAELNVLPHGARSWEVLDGGKHYLFHLRDDVRWTNGQSVIAADYEGAWKRNLRLNLPTSGALLDDVVGARAFRQGSNGDPNSVAVNALDALTLEVRLNAPTAYFPYIVGLPISFPLPHETIEKYGDEWWKPEHIVSNGPFRLVEYETQFDEQQFKLAFERNQDYCGESLGNVDRARYVPRNRMASSNQELRIVRGQQFLGGEFDLVVGNLPTDPSTGQTIGTGQLIEFFTKFLTLNPFHPPLNDLRVRRALFHALDRERLKQMDALGTQEVAEGGMIPPGMAGHSPGIGLTHDLNLARELLAEAGFPNGHVFRTLQVNYHFSDERLFQSGELARQWREGLGIETTFQSDAPGTNPDVMLNPWVADYPDPDTFMRYLVATWDQTRLGWYDPTYFALVEEAAHTTDRSRRMALYRQADHLLVVDQALVYPRSHLRRGQAVKPRVKHSEFNALGMIYFKNIVIEPH